MIYSMFSVQDSKAGRFFPPYPAPNAGVGLRDFQDALRNSNSPMAKHPEDYALFEVGTWDDQLGKSTNLEVPKMLGTGNQFVAS